MFNNTLTCVSLSGRRDAEGWSTFPNINNPSPPPPHPPTPLTVDRGRLAASTSGTRLFHGAPLALTPLASTHRGTSPSSLPDTVTGQPAYRSGMGKGKSWVGREAGRGGGGYMEEYQ